MGRLKQIAKKLILGHKSSPEDYADYCRALGMHIGERSRVYEPSKTFLDETRPYMINIGDDVVITRGVTILTHGYDWCVLARMNDTVLGSAGEVVIGNNVFIGMNTMILKGVHIGSNVVIGANSLVNKDVPDNCVVAGNPAKVVMSIEEYGKRRVAVQKKEAFEVYRTYVERFGKEPPMEIFDEFFWLFYRRGDELPECFKKQMRHRGRFEETLANFKGSSPEFDGFEEFLKAAREDMQSRASLGG